MRKCLWFVTEDTVYCSTGFMFTLKSPHMRTPPLFTFINTGTMGVAQSLQSTLERMLDFSRLWSSASIFGHSAYGTGHALWNLGVALSSNSIFAFMCFSLTMPFSNTFVWSCKSWDSLCLELQLWLLRFVDILRSLIACQSSWIKKSWSMGIEYCHKSRVQIKHPRVHFFPPRTLFHALTSYFLSCISAL